jgi:hypothetical protein
MGRQRTRTGSYSEQEFGGKGSKDKIRNVDIGPAPGKDAYAIKSFAHIDKPIGVGSGRAPTNPGKVVQKDRAPLPVETRWNLSSKFLGARGKRGSSE